ncbi:hypothetical protein D3C71_1337240 [compost metagenome]
MHFYKRYLLSLVNKPERGFATDKATAYDNRRLTGILLAQQHVFRSKDFLGFSNIKYARGRASRKDYNIGLAVQDRLLRNLTIEMNIDIQIIELRLVPGGEQMIIFFKIGCSSRNQITAKPVVLLVQGNLMAAKRSDSGGFTPGRAAADDEHLFLSICLIDSVLFLSPAGWINRTGDGGEGLKPSHAAFLTGEAWAYAVHLLRLDFVRYFGVRQ